MHQLPETGFLRLPQIIGDAKRDIPPVIPVSKSTWWNGVRCGRYLRATSHCRPSSAMTAQVGIEVDAAHVLATFANLRPSAIEGAWRRTLRKTGNYVKTLVAREVSRAYAMPISILRWRLNTYLKSPSMAKVWLGLNPIEAHRLGPGGLARRTSRGVTAGRHRFDGAWLMPVYGKTSDGNRYQRVRERKRRGGGSSITGKTIVMRREGKGRLPLEKVTYAWDEAGRAAFMRAVRQIEQRLLVILRQELNYELAKATGRVAA